MYLLIILPLMVLPILLFFTPQRIRNDIQRVSMNIISYLVHLYIEFKFWCHENVGFRHTKKNYEMSKPDIIHHDLHDEYRYYMYNNIKYITLNTHAPDLPMNHEIHEPPVISDIIFQHDNNIVECYKEYSSKQSFKDIMQMLAGPMGDFNGLPPSLKKLKNLSLTRPYITSTVNKIIVNNDEFEEFIFI